MTVHFFTKGDKSAGSSRQRAFLVAEELNKIGMHAIVHQPPLIFSSLLPWYQKIKLIFRYVAMLFRIKKSDVIYLQRTIYNKYFFVLIVVYELVFRRKMIFDFDDAIYLHSPVKTKILTKFADAVIVGSHALADWAKKYNKNVRIIPTSVLFESYERFSRFKRSDNQKFVIGWIGNASDHYENLKILKPVFQRLVNDSMPFKFILVGALCDQKVYSFFRSIKDLDVEFINSLDWADSESVPKMIQNFDIGLMPLLDTEWNKGKCAFKAVEYMACGVPSIVSPVGEDNYLVQDGQNGFLANSTEEWVAKIKEFYNNIELRSQMGKQARETIKLKYSYEANIPILQSLLEKL
jgi:glycosyltransferase involved in cell wall biosynthesis